MKIVYFDEDGGCYSNKPRAYQGKLATGVAMPDDEYAGELAKARREALEEAISRYCGYCGDCGSNADTSTCAMAYICGLRALMEKDAPERPTSDALDPAGVEAAAKQLVFAADQMRAAKDLGWEYTLMDAAKDVVTAYLKAAKGGAKF